MISLTVNCMQNLKINPTVGKLHLVNSLTVSAAFRRKEHSVAAVQMAKGEQPVIYHRTDAHRPSFWV